MFTLFGFAQVLDLLETRGRFRKFSLRTPEGFIFEASLWMVLELLENPVEDEVFSFSGFCPSEGQVLLTAFRPAVGIDPSRIPPTTTCTTGTVIKLEEDNFTLEYYSYNKATKVSVPVAHTVVLRGDRWERRRAVLRPGTQVQVLGTLDGPSKTDCDDFWVFLGKEPPSSPAKRTFSNVFAARPPVTKPVVFLSDFDMGDHSQDVGGPSSSASRCGSLPPVFSAPSSPLLLPEVEEEQDMVFTSTGKGKKPASKRARQG
jgi:hypothetical protein